ncbi:MAG: hypothetical protein HRU28_12540 [Rhizobiales bacterium]|nr:hypothetical protein [Hyphomicrobiales bacterium]
MPKYTCKTCGVQQSNTQNHSNLCPICEDERQYVPSSGQEWIKLADHYNQHHINWVKVETNAYQLSLEPKIGIGQTAFFIETKHGNYLWDCLPLINDKLIEDIKAKGGLNAIAISHPHYYSNAADWATEFNIPIYIHHDDKEWFQDDDDNVLFWQGDTLNLEDDLTLIKCGGHFNGGTILHWSNTHDNKGAVFTADIIAPQARHNSLSFMYSYPNKIPLSGQAVKHIGKIVSPYAFDRLYGPFGTNVMPHADKIVQQSVKRYLEAIKCV